MTLQDQARHLERHTFFNGQRLFADDLQGLEAFSREMRWLHNRSLHQPGIGNGFAVHGLKGDRKVRVDAGYAIDSKGREIVQIESEELDVPPVAGERDGSPTYYDLVVSYPDDAMLEVAETRAGVCAPRGAVRLREEPVFCWVRLVRTEGGGSAQTTTTANGIAVQENLVAVDARLGAEIESGLRIVIARAEILNCQLNRDLSIAERRNARPALGPHIACGEYAPDPWQVYWWSLEEDVRNLIAELITNRLGGGGPVISSFPSVSAVGSALSSAGNIFARGSLLGGLGPIILPIGLEVIVPTASACFQGAPHYSVRLAGERLLTLDLVEVLQNLGMLDLSELDENQLPELEEAREQLQLDFYLEGLISVLDPLANQFTARIAVMVQLLEYPDIESFRTLFSLREYFADKFQTTPLGEKLQSCEPLTGQARTQCVAEAVDLTIDVIEEQFLALIEQLGWSLAWMGVEG
jgi:hypothetical protein